MIHKPAQLCSQIFSKSPGNEVESRPPPSLWELYASAREDSRPLVDSHSNRYDGIPIHEVSRSWQGNAKQAL